MSVDVKVVGGRFVTVYPAQQLMRHELTVRKRGNHHKEAVFMRFFYGDYMDDVQPAIMAQGD